jgi:D-lactate dehydrogenase (cytochrome)
MRYLSPRNRARFADFVKNPPARQLVATMRERLRDVMDAHGAVHSQIGRFYRFGDDVLLARLKAALDPDGRLNPGVLAERS